MKEIKFWIACLSNGDGSHTIIQFQTKEQAETAAKNNIEYMGEDMGNEVSEDSIYITDMDEIALGEDAEYYLSGILEDM